MSAPHASHCSPRRWRSSSPRARSRAAPSAPSRRPTPEPSTPAAAPGTTHPPTRSAASPRAHGRSAAGHRGPRAPPRPRPRRLAFRIVDEHDKTVRDFDVEHTKRMHLIVARRDLTGFQHLHPEQRADGAWETPVQIPDAGSYRVFADFVRDGEPQTLASDLRVDGAADLRALPAPAPTAALRRRLRRRAAQRRRPPRRGGRAALHDHEGRRAGRDRALPRRRRAPRGAARGRPRLPARAPDQRGRLVEVAFGATFPTAGRYRLFLQFQHDGAVQTVAFTQEVR